MNFEPTGDQRLLVETARSFVDRSCPPEVVRSMETSDLGYDSGHWATAASLGWAGLVVSAEHGGSGQGLLELSLLCEQLGRGPVPTPLIPHALTTLAVAAFGTDAQRYRWLPALASGEQRATVALLDRGATNEWDESKVRVGRPAAKVLVPYAAGADHVLVASADGLVMAEARTLTLRRHAAFSGEALFEVTATALVGDVIAAGDEVVPFVLDAGAVLSLAYGLGCAERALEMSVEHARTREQFGRPIGSFQAVAHRCADMRSDIDACRYLAYQAAWAIDRDRSAAGLEVAAAKSYANDALRRVFLHAHQVHGAIGFSTEHDLHLFTRRLKAFELTFGSTARHRQRLAASMGLNS